MVIDQLGQFCSTESALRMTELTKCTCRVKFVDTCICTSFIEFDSFILFKCLHFFFHPQPGMRQKLEQIAQQLDWIERMDVTVAREKEDKDGSLKTAAMSTLTSEKSIHDDFQREMRL